MTTSPLRSACRFILAFFALFSVAVTAWADTPAGTWKWTAEGLRGREVESTLTLSLQDNQLSGTIDNRLGKVEIREAKFADDQVAFTVVRKVRRREITVKYAGKLEGDTIKGTIETTGRDEKPVSVPWNAERVR